MEINLEIMNLDILKPLSFEEQVEVNGGSEATDLFWYCYGTTVRFFVETVKNPIRPSQYR